MAAVEAPAEPGEAVRLRLRLDSRLRHLVREDATARILNEGMVGGKVVGVCSTGDVADPGADTHAGSNYAVLTQSAAWIRSTAGI